MTSFVRIHLVSVVAVTILGAGACQSAQERQANELREFLRSQLANLEPLNEQVLEEKQKLYEIDSTSPFANVEETRQEQPKRDR